MRFLETGFSRNRENKEEENIPGQYDSLDWFYTSI